MSETITARLANVNNLLLQSITESARQIYFLIAENDGIKTKELRLKSVYSARTIRYSIRTLINLNLIKQLPDLQDCRSHLYVINQNA